MKSDNGPERAFGWICSILRDRSIPFVCTGGLAARVYGSTRPLFDIDIDIPEDRFAELIPLVQKYRVSGPERFRDEVFDIYLLTLEYEGQLIDITGGESVRLFDMAEQAWKPDPTDFVNVEVAQVFGLSVPIVRKETLIRYKKWIARSTDLQDVAEIEPLD
jgi:hypothetical protein